MLYSANKRYYDENCDFDGAYICHASILGLLAEGLLVLAHSVSALVAVGTAAFRRISAVGAGLRAGADENVLR